MTVGAAVGVTEDDVTDIVTAQVATAVATALAALPFAEVVLSNVNAATDQISGAGLPGASAGRLIGTLSITPNNATARIQIVVRGWGDIDGDEPMYFVLYRGSTVIGITGITFLKRGDGIGVFGLNVFDAPATTSAVTYNLRAGSNSNKDWWINNTKAGITFGGSAPTKGKMSARQL